MSTHVQILLEDEHCLAIVKPAGQFVQGVWRLPGNKRSNRRCAAYLDPNDPGAVYLGIVHRLDRPVSGVLIWAKTPKAARRLSMQFQSRRAYKEYWAVVEAAVTPSEAEGTWTDWLTTPGVSGVVKASDPGTAGARQAVTRFQCAEPVQIPAGLRWLRLGPKREEPTSSGCRRP